MESSELVACERSAVVGEEFGRLEYCSLLSNCWRLPISCWSGRVPFFACIDDDNSERIDQWDDMLLQYYSPKKVDETRDDSLPLKLSTLKRKRRVKEPSLSPTHEEEDDESTDNEEVNQLNEEDPFSGRNFKKSKPTCSIIESKSNSTTSTCHLN